MSEIEKIKEKLMKQMQAEEKTPDMPGKPVKATDATFDSIVSQYDLVVVDMWAPWCGPCRMIAPVIEKLAQEMKGKVVFAKLNTDENPMTAMKYRVMSIPTLLLFKNGTLADRAVGALPADMLKDWIERHL
ncbi:MAG: thioredoxin [Thermoplasmata archaeon]|nr:MAG: thioredoxin [Thermoplasmata archaeon]RLF33552.1 MAG: thioredoxin [Thermoplasmata archaeon]RLF40780.1 MAG: thioredoxin [Thermoplasmata archaeon]RLF54628.1 MAG: thioredoxin [Thermoplasmata archaeon]HDN50322.1 thioredoxin [Thermoplasmatales archaeon]